MRRTSPERGSSSSGRQKLAQQDRPEWELESGGSSVSTANRTAAGRLRGDCAGGGSRDKRTEIAADVAAASVEIETLIQCRLQALQEMGKC